MNADKDWKLKLRNGRLRTPFRHFTVIAEGVVVSALAQGFECRAGSAMMSLKAWARTAEDSRTMTVTVGRKVGFEVTGMIQTYETEPSQPPDEVPIAYDLSFAPLDASRG